MGSVFLRAIAAAVGLLVASTACALAERNIALVIGNSAYKNVSRLPNPVRDAALIAKLFKESNFEVIESRSDVTIADMRRALRDFADKARDADIAVVYYAGHGIEVDGVNYLLPIDTVLERDIDVEDEAVSLDRVMRVLEPAKRLRLVILDACRDNPFAKTMKRTLGTRSVGRGLGKVEPTNSDTLVAFAAKAGSTAADGEGSNSPFSTALSKHLATPGLDLRIAFGRVRDEVFKVTSGRQEPFVYGSLGGSTVSLVPEPEVKTAAPPAPAADPSANMRQDYELAAQIGTKDAWDAFLAQHTTGLYANLARAARGKIVAAEEATKSEAERSAREKAARDTAAAAAAAKAETQRQAEAQKAEADKAAEAQRQAEAKKKAEADKLAEAQKAAESQKVALLTPPAAPAPAAGPPPLSGGALVQEIKKELKRVGCFAGRVDENWKSSDVKASVAKFAKFANVDKTPDEPAADFLDVIRGKSMRVCPLECGKTEVEKNGACVAKVCPSGQELDSDGACQKIKAKTAARPAPSEAKPSEPAAAPAKPAAASGGNTITFCVDRLGCRTGTVHTTSQGNHCQMRRDGKWFCPQ